MLPQKINNYKAKWMMPDWIKRSSSLHQMDMKSVKYQMKMLLGNPKQVYKSAYYRKQTKNRWARDDPAFVIVQFGLLVLSCILWSVVLKVSSVVQFFGVLLQVILLEWIITGMVAATMYWYIINAYLVQSDRDNVFVKQRVEWQYAIDIHCNGYFVKFLLTHGGLLIMAPIFLNTDGFIGLLLGNGLYAFGYVQYFYITFLGYAALPFVEHSERLLYPIGMVLGLFGCSLLFKMVLGVGLPMWKWSIWYYFGY